MDTVQARVRDDPVQHRGGRGLGGERSRHVRAEQRGRRHGKVDISTLIYTYLHISKHIYTYLQVTWADVLDFYIRLDQERSKATVFQPLHHDGDFKAAQHSR